MIRQNKKMRIWMLATVFLAVGIILCTPKLIRGKAAEDIPAYISAIYGGEAGLVGSTIERQYLVVQAVYEDGSAVDVSDYYLSTEKIQREGMNEVAVVYRGKKTSFFIQGKRVTELSAFYFGEEVSVGNSVSKRNIYVFANYSDGSVGEVTEYVIGSPLITKTGTNVVHIVYGGKYTAIEVPGRIGGTISSLQVTYAGGEVMLGSPINHDDIYVTALYTDGTSETISNYQLSMETPSMIGANTVIVTYRLRTASFIVTGYEKGIKKLTANYTGSGVEVGKEVRKSDINVTATYTDGSVETVTDFDLPTPVIYFVGSHIKTVHYMGMTADIYVVGIEAMPTSYDNAAEFTVSNGIESATCRVALPSGVDKSVITGESLRKASVSQVVPRAIRRSDFIAFEIIAEPEGEDELPLEMKIRLPEGYNPDDCVLYYTPNRKTIIARMNTFVNADGELELVIYKTGTFLLAYEPEPEEEEQEEKQ